MEANLLEFKPWSTHEQLVEQIAKFAIESNLVRRGNDFYDFSPAMVEAANQAKIGRKSRKLRGGYCFLDEDAPSDTESLGMVRLLLRPSGNPKWGFELLNGELTIGDA